MHAELDRVLGGRAPTPADVPKLVYTRQVIDESMRLYPPIPVLMRHAVADDVVCGRHVPAKSLIAIMPYVVHHHRKLWPDPERFDPDRFTPENIRSRSRYSYIPFSVGPRACVGLSLAMLELVLIIATMAQRFRFHLVPGHKIEPVGWVTLRPHRGVRVTVEQRSEARAAAG